MITSSGIGSGLDVEGLVTQLVQSESEPTEFRLNNQEGLLSAELSAYGTLKSALSTLQAASARLRTSSTFDQREVQLSSSDEISVTASASAPIGSFDLEVLSLAETHSLVSGAFSSIDDTVGTGTMTIRFGTTDYVSGTDTYNGFSLNEDSSTVSIDIGSGNSSLAQVRDTINEAGANVTAAIVDDGTGFRLLITGSEAGAANSLEISVSDDDANDTDSLGLSTLAFNASAHHLDQTAEASDATMTLNGLSISHGSNTITGAVDGLTFSLKQTTSEAVSLNVSKDTSAIKSAVSEAVNGFRAFNSVVNQLGNFDAATSSGSILLGDSTLRSVTSRIRQVLASPADNVSGAFRNLSEIGVTTDINGNLQIDDAKLDQIISNSPEELSKLFAVVGLSADDQMSFTTSTTSTQSGTYDVFVSQLATQGSIVGSSVLPDFAMSETLVIDDSNDELTVSMNGVLGSAFSLTQGTYTSGESLAAEIESRINGVSEFTTGGVVAEVTYDALNNRLEISSETYGATSSVEISAIDSGTSTSLGLSVGVGTNGVNIAGLIDGLAAEGNGQILTAASGSNGEGLTLTITGGDIGARSAFEFTRGLGDELNSVISSLLAGDGLIDARTSGISGSIEQVQKDREDHLLRMQTIEARYRAQFGALDTLIAQLQSTGNFLTSALASLPSSNSQ